LIGAKVATPGLDARLLCTAALEINAATLLAHDEVPVGETGAARLITFLKRRLRGESVARIIGIREFWGLPFQLSPETLEPRPDTECLVENALNCVKDRQAPLRILDLGTGSGCILISLLHELPCATGTGADICPEAVKAASNNAQLNNVVDRAEFVVSDWASAVNGTFDLIVSNPPYIRSDVIATLDAEVRYFDPLRALDGGEDGLDAYRRILKDCSSLLCETGTLVMEIGFDQELDLRHICGDTSFEIIRVNSDLAGHARVVTLRKSKPESVEKAT